MWREPEPDEVRSSGYALLTRIDGYVEHVPSCFTCASTVGLTWVDALFEGVCRGCECSLSGFPNGA